MRHHFDDLTGFLRLVDCRRIQKPATHALSEFTMKPLSPLRLLGAGCLAVFVYTQSASALDFSWDPLNDASGGTATWNTSSAFWDAGSFATGENTNILWANGAANIANFGGFSGTVTLGTAITVGGLTFNDNFGYLLTGSSLTFGAAGAIVTNADAQISSTIAGSVAIAKRGSGILALIGSNTFSGQLTVEEGILQIGTINGASASGVLGNSANAVVLGKTGGYTGTLQYTGSSSTSTKKFTMVTGGEGGVQVDLFDTVLTLSGLIDGGGALSKTGAGTLSLTGLNSFTGGFNLLEGVLSVGSATALGTTGPISFGGGTLKFAITTDLSARFSSSAGQSYNFDTNGLTVTLATAMTSPSGSLSKLGSGTLTLTGANTFDGGTIVAAGTLAVTGSGRFGSSTGSVTVNNGGTLSLGSTNQTVGAVTLLNGGSLTGTGTLSASSFDVEGGTISVKLGGASGVLTKNGTDLTVILTAANTYGGGTVIYDGTLTVSGSGTLGASTAPVTVDRGTLNLGTVNQTVGDVSLTNNGLISGTGVLSGSSFNLYSGMVSGRLGGPGALNKEGVDTVVLTGINTYAGGTNVNDGILRAKTVLSLPGQTMPGKISVAGGAILGLNVGGAGEFTPTDISNILTNGTFATNSILGLDTTTASFNYTSNFTSSVGLAKLGTNTLTLSGAANSYTGGTSVLGGILVPSVSGALGASSGFLTVDGAALGTAVLSLGTINQTVGVVSVLNGGSITGTATLTGSSFYLETGATTPAIISAKLAGATAMLTKGGEGTVTLSAPNTYGGGTTVSSGTLAISGTGTLGASTGALTVDGGILNIVATNQGVAEVKLLSGGQITGTSGTLTGTAFTVKSGTISAKLAGIGAILTKSTTDTVTLTGANSYTGATMVNRGTLQVKTALSLPGLTTPGLISVAAGATLGVNVGGLGEFAVNDITNLVTNANFAANSIVGFDTTGSFALTSSITKPIGLTKLGTGTLALSGATNSYTGGTIVSAGTLALSGSGKLGATTGALTVDGSSTILNLGGTTQISGAVSLLNGAQINTGTLTGTSFQLESGSVSANLAGVGTVLSKSNYDPVTLTGANTFSGGVNLSQGLLALGSTGALGSSGTIHLLGGTLQFSASNKNDYSSRFSTSAGQAYNLDTNGQPVILASNLTSSGGALNKTGLGMLTLSGANTYSGATIIQSGTLKIAKVESLPGQDSYGMIQMGLGTTLTINAGGVGEFDSSSLDNLLTNTIFDYDTSLSIDTTNGNAEAAASITQPVKLVKLGGNTLTLSGENSYTGGTVLGASNQANAGILEVSGAGTLGSSGSLVIYGGTLQLNGSTLNISDLTMGAGASGSTAAISIGSGELFLEGNLEYLSTNNTNGATISGTAGGALSLLGSNTFTVGNSSIAPFDLTISADIQNGDFSARSLTKAGTGTLLLTGTNTYTGPTNIDAGSVWVTKVASLPGQTTAGKISVAAGANLTINLGGSGEFAPSDLANILANSTFGSNSVLGLDTTNAAGGTFINTQNITGSRSITKLGPGTLILSGAANTYSGTTLISAGTLQVNGSMGSGGLISVPTASTLGVGASASIVRNVTVSGGLVNLSGVLGTNTTFTLSSGTVNVLGSGASAAIVQLPVKGVTPVFSAPAGQELTVTTRLTQTLTDGSLTITAGVAPSFKVAGTNLVNNIDNLILRGGTTKIDRIIGSAAAASLPTTNVDVTATSVLNMAFAGKATLGSLNLTLADLTLQTATGVSFDTITATDNSSILGTVPVSLRTGNVTVSPGKSLTLSAGVIDGTLAGPLAKLGAGTLTLGGTSSYTGATTLGEGTLILDGTLGSTAITVSSGATLTQNPSGTIGRTASLTVSGTATLNGVNTFSGTTTLNAGTLTLGGANTGTGGTILNAGTLFVTHTNALQNSTVTFNGGVLNIGALGSVPLGGITANVNTTVNSVLTTIAGYPTWTAAATKTLTVSGAVTRAAGSAINFVTTGTITGAGLGTLLGINTVNAWATSGGTDWAIYDGTKIAAFTGYTAMTGTSSAPVITNAPAANYKLDTTTTNNATLAATGTITLNTLVISDSTARTVDVRNGAAQGVVRLGVAGGILMGGGAQTIGVSGAAGTLTAGGATLDTPGELTFTVDTSGGTINSVIADNGSGMVSLAKFGTGSLTLNGNNTYSGDTTINTGPVIPLGGNGIPNGAGKGNVVIDASGTLALSTSTETINALNGAGTVNNAAGSSTLTVGDGDANGTFSGVLSNPGGALAFTKIGSGTQTLTATNTYGGRTTVSGGTLALDFSASNPTSILLSTAPLTLGGGTLSVMGKSTGTTAQTVASTTLGAGSAASAVVVNANGGGGTLLTLGAITRNPGTSVAFTLPAGTQSATNGITTTAGVSSGILGSYATIGNEWAAKSGTNIIPLSLATTTYTDISTLGATVTSSSSTNVRINPGGGGTLILGSATTAINTLLHNSSSAATVDTLAKVLQTSGIMLASGQAALTVGTAAGHGFLIAATSGGELVLTNKNTTSNLTINAVIRNNANPSSLTKVGPGTVVLTGANTHTGATYLNSGTLTLTNPAALQYSTVTFGGGTLNIGALSGLSFGGITANVNTTVGSDLTTIAGNPTWTAADGVTLTIDGIVPRTVGKAINFGTTGTITGASLGTLLGTNTANSWATFGGSDWAIYNGSQIAAYTAYSPVTGTASAPTLATSIGANRKIDNTTTNNVTLAAAGTIDLNSLVVNGSTARTIDLGNGSSQGILRLGSAGGILLAGGIHTIGVSGLAGTLTAGGASVNSPGELLVTASGSGTINSVIADNGSGRVFLTTNGAGVLTTNGINTYSGDTTINAGSLNPLGGNGIPNGLGKGNVFIGSAGLLTLSAVTETINGLNGSGSVSSAASASTLIVGDGNADGTFSGVLKQITGSLLLTKIGTGTQTLTGTSTNTGRTTVSQGTLTLDFSVNNPVNILSTSAPSTLSGGSLSILAKSSGTTVQTIAGTTLGAASSPSTSAIIVNANGGGGAVLNLGSISRIIGSRVNFTLPAGTQSATNGITTSTGINANGILGSYATVGNDWATKSATSTTNIVAYTAYTNVAALGGTIAHGATTNVRINSAGVGANLALGAATTTMSTLLQNTTTAATVDTLGKVLQTTGIMLGSGQAALTIGAVAGNGVLNPATSGGELMLINKSTVNHLVINAPYQNNSTGAAVLSVAGPGTVVLNGVNTHIGATNVGGGKLTISSAATINTTSGIFIGGGDLNYNSATALSKNITFNGIGGTLSGTGTITPLVTVTAYNTVAPGNSVGTLSFGTGLTIAGSYAAELGTPGATPAAGVSDRLAVTGDLTLTGGTLNLSDNAGASGQGAAGVGAYRLMTFTGTRTGTFASVINPAGTTLHGSVVYTGTSTGTVDLTVYRMAAANTIGTPLNLGMVRVGGTFGTSALSIQNTAANDGFSEGLNASGGALTGAASSSGSVTNLAAGLTNGSSLLVGLGGSANTTVAGLKTGTVLINLASNGSGTSGYGAMNLTGQTVSVSGTVYSGLMVWNGASGASWNSNANWNDSQDAAVHMVPGLDVGFTGVDTATFGNTAGSVTVNLNGVTPNLNAITFNNTGSYTIAKGSGATGITLAGTTPAITAAGTHTISTPITLASNATVALTNPGDSLTVSGIISGSTRGLTKNGLGTLTLTGANGYAGATIVAGGTLSIGVGGSLANSAVTVQSGGTLAGVGTLAGSTTIQGIEAPGGAGAGIQTFSNSLAFASTSHLQWQLADDVTTGRGTSFDGVDVTGGTFSITSGATLDLSFGGAVSFLDTFWNSARTWTIADLGSGLSGDGGNDLFTLGAITGGSYSPSEGSFSVTRVADANGKKDVVLNWSAAGAGGSDYTIWIGSKGLAGPSSLPDADPDLDGLTNSVEFVLGGEPNPANPGSNSVALLPAVSRNPGGDMIFTFRRKDLSETAATVAFQWSANLAFPGANLVPVLGVDSTTSGVSVDVTENSPDAATDTILITVPVAKAVGGRLFGRLLVTVP